MTAATTKQLLYWLRSRILFGWKATESGMSIFSVLVGSEMAGILVTVKTKQMTNQINKAFR